MIKPLFQKVGFLHVAFLMTPLTFIHTELDNYLLPNEKMGLSYHLPYNLQILLPV